jgi:hypothetical protein
MNRESLEALLKRAGLPVTGEEFERLLSLSEVVDKHNSRLRLDDARYAEPASIYSAANHE